MQSGDIHIYLSQTDIYGIFRNLENEVIIKMLQKEKQPAVLDKKIL